MNINLKFNSVNDFNNNLTFIKNNYNLIDEKIIVDFIYSYIYDQLKNILNNVNIRNYIKLIDKLYNKNIKIKNLNLINNLSNLLTDNFILFNFDNNYYTPLNKKFIIDELLNIIDNY